MNSQTLRSYLSENSVWASIKAITPLPFLEGDGVNNVDALTKINYGSRLMFSGFDGVAVEMVANNIVSLYGEKWDALIKANVSAIDITLQYGNTRKETTTTSGNKTGETNQEDKVSAYNSDDLITDKGHAGTSKEDTTGTNIKTYEGGQNSLEYLFNNLPLLDKTNIINTVVRDVVNYLTISTY